MDTGSLVKSAFIKTLSVPLLTWQNKKYIYTVIYTYKKIKKLQMDASTGNCYCYIWIQGITGKLIVVVFPSTINVMA